MSIIFRTQPLKEAKVHLFSVGGELDFNYGIYKGQVLREDADESLRIDATETSPSGLTDEERQELAREPAQLMCTKYTTARIELVSSGRIVYGHLCWWREAANETLMH